MRCTGDRCAALVGTVGQSTSCAIHPVRPDVCRACSPGDPECREARRHFGLDEGFGVAPIRRLQFRSTDLKCQERR
jgi:Fe-S-cluster containining protein